MEIFVPLRMEKKYHTDNNIIFAVYVMLRATTAPLLLLSSKPGNG